MIGELEDILQGIVGDIKAITRRVNHLETRPMEHWVYLSAPLTSTSWDGDARTTTAKTTIDLSSVFGVPAGVKAIIAKIIANDSTSAAQTTKCWFILAPNNTAGSGQGILIAGLPNDAQHMESVTIGCDANGDVYFQCDSGGVGTLDINLSIWGYLI
jgi:hypothetical protein